MLKRFEIQADAGMRLTVTDYLDHPNEGPDEDSGLVGLGSVYIYLGDYEKKINEHSARGEFLSVLKEEVPDLIKALQEFVK